MSDLSDRGLDRPDYYVTALSIGGIVCIAASNGGTTSQDLKTGFLVGATPKYQQIAILIGALASALILGPILIRLNDNRTVYAQRITFAKVDDQRASLACLGSWRVAGLRGRPEAARAGQLSRADARAKSPKVEGLGEGEYLVNETGKIVYKVERNFKPELRADPSSLVPRNNFKGPQAAEDSKHLSRLAQDRTLKADAQVAIWSMPRACRNTCRSGHQRQNKMRPDGSTAEKFDAPKATLMSYIIKGILNRELPWDLVLLGVMIAIVLEMAGIPSLAFAVGVYLPLSASSPIFIGGMVRWLVDRHLRRKHAQLTEEEFVAETDKSPGVLMASGYIAGAAIAGIIIAFMAGYFTDLSMRLKNGC